MPRMALYYPSVDIPHGGWIRQATLYWDGVSSIVPKRYYESIQGRLSQNVEILRDEGLYTPSYPDKMYSIFADDVYNDFVRIWQGRNRTIFDELNARIPATSVIRDKLHGRLLRYCVSAQIATEGESGFVTMDTGAFLIFITLLAKAISLSNSDYMIASTDVPLFDLLAFQQFGSEMQGLRANLTLQNCLPCPSSEVSISQIINFKRKRNQELLEFRACIDRFGERMSACATSEEVRRETAKFSEEIQREISKVERLLSENNITHLKSTAKSVISIESPALWASVGAALTESGVLSGVPSTWPIVGLAVAGMVQVSMGIADAWLGRRGVLRGSPYAFLYEARREGIIG